MSDKLIKGLVLLEALIRVRQERERTENPKEKIGLTKAEGIIANLGIEITGGKPDETIMP